MAPRWRGAMGDAEEASAMSDDRGPVGAMRPPGGDAEAGRRQPDPSAGSSGSGAMRDVAADIRNQAASLVDEVRQEGSSVLEAAQQRGGDLLEQQKQAGAEQAGHVARAVHRAADELQGGAPWLASQVHEAASALDDLGRSLRERSPGELIGGVEAMARQQPVAFFGAAVLAGFALARFARASSPAVPGRGTSYGADWQGRTAGAPRRAGTPGGSYGVAGGGVAGQGAGSMAGTRPGADAVPAGSYGAGLDATGSGLGTSSSGASALPGGVADAAPPRSGSDDVLRGGTTSPASPGTAAAPGASGRDAPGPFGT
jgi:hypothetical protein